jgi:hypothetical protein
LVVGMLSVRLIVAAIIIFWIGGVSLAQSQEEPGQNGSQNHSTQPQAEQRPSDTNPSATAKDESHGEQKAEQEKGPDAEAKAKPGFLSSAFRAIERSEKVINVFSTITLAVFTALLFIATLILAASTDDLRKYAEEQASDMKRSISEAKRSADVAEKSLIASNRPWVKVDIAVGGPIFYNVNGVNFTIRYILTNIGHSPASNVWVTAKVITPEFGSANNQHFDPRSSLREEIAQLKSRPPMPFGFPLFPGETITQDITVSIGAEDLKRITKEFPLIFPNIVGAADYRMGFDDRAHQTGFVIEVRRSDAPRPESTAKNRYPAAIFTDEGDIPAAEVRLFRSFIEGGYAD